MHVMLQGLQGLLLKLRNRLWITAVTGMLKGRNLNDMKHLKVSSLDCWWITEKNWQSASDLPCCEQFVLHQQGRKQSQLETAVNKAVMHCKFGIKTLFADI
jgi:folylpolyglutamate synthase/dihydropteroate synthase